MNNTRTIPTFYNMHFFGIFALNLGLLSNIAVATIALGQVELKDGKNTPILNSKCSEELDPLENSIVSANDCISWMD